MKRLQHASSGRAACRSAGGRRRGRRRPGRREPGSGARARPPTRSASGTDAARAPGLRRAELAAHVAAADADPAGGPVDVAPAQREQLALAQPGHRRGEVQHALGRGPSVVGRDRGRSSASSSAWSRKRMSGSASVAAACRPACTGCSPPSRAAGELEDRVQQTEVVEHRLRRLPVAALGRDERLDVVGRRSRSSGASRRTAPGGRAGTTRSRSSVERLRPSALRWSISALARLPTVDARRRRLGVAPRPPCAAQLALRLRAGQAVARPGLAPRADLALDLAAVEGTSSRAALVLALSRASRCRSCAERPSRLLVAET